jgi:hypothetical protein
MRLLVSLTVIFPPLDRLPGTRPQRRTLSFDNPSNHSVRQFVARFATLQESHVHPYTRGEIGSKGEARMPISRNILFLIIGALAIVAAVLGYNLYQEKKQPEGVQINIGPNGLKIENK